MQRTRELMKKYPPEIHTGVELVSSVGGNQSNADIQYFIQGPDLDKLAHTPQALLAKMRPTPAWWTRTPRCAAASRNCGWKSTARAPPIWASASWTSNRR